MEEEIVRETKKSNLWIWIILALLAILLTLGGLYLFVLNDKDQDKDEISKKESGKTYENLSNTFGFLGGGEGDGGETIAAKGAGWIRPHPGGVLWDSMQSSINAEIDFSSVDSDIKNLQNTGLDILITIWGFADWDQKNLANAYDCKVSSEDEFLPRNDTKGRGYYLPEYRCNPSNWDAHNEWVSSVVERYDGDGVDDMPGLIKPIKYWEVMNEPDLSYNTTLPASETNRLTFYKLGPTDYGELLKQTSAAIHSADADAKVLIAGAAGASSNMLSFYKTLFSSVSDAKNYFDIGNIHCISNDRETHDFNVGNYKQMLADAGINDKPIWVTEAEAMYGNSAEENYQNTLTSSTKALNLGAEKIFFTRSEFDDTRKDMSKDKYSTSGYDSETKFKELITSLTK